MWTNAFMIKLTTLIPVFTCEMEKWLSKLPIVIQRINERARNKSGLPLDHSWVFKPQRGEACLLAAKYDTLPWLACAGNLMARKLPSLPQNRFMDLSRNLCQRFIVWSGKSLFCLKHKAWYFHVFPTCSNIGSLCEVYSLSRKRYALHIKKKTTSLNHQFWMLMWCSG